MYANMESQNQPAWTNQNFQGGNRGRGRGGRFYSRGGRGRGQQYNYRQGRNMSRITCFRCDKTGHFAQDCPDRLLKLQETQEDKEVDTQEADELMMHEVVFLNEKMVVPNNYETSPGDDIWYLDNGASNHMTENYMYFTELDESITGKVRFGDDSRINIKGKGSISFVDKNGEMRTMADVYFIPELKNNIISLGQATESGCDVRMREDYLTLHDRDGKLLVNAKRSKNILYKVCMGLNSSMCLQIKTISDSARWHARLGHINFFTAASILRAETFGIPTPEWAKTPMGLAEAVEGVIVPDFEPRNDAKIVTDEKATSLSTAAVDDAAVIDELIAELERCRLSLQPEFRMKPIQFEKDDDTNYHMDLIAGLANMRARNYSVPEAEILTKAFGRIKFCEMRSLIGVQDISKCEFKLKGDNVGLSLN